MKLDVTFLDQSLAGAGEFARWAESFGADGVWVPETRHNPFVPLTLMARATERVQLGTGVAIAFARSPTALAHLGWDLAALSDGRFSLGLGTQVRAHIERRFGASWEPPAPKLRETVEAIQAVWESWRSGKKLDHRGEHYKLTLMPSFFSPDPGEYRYIPVSIAGVNPALIRLAGESADGFHLHPLHTRRYLAEVIHPEIEAGAERAGRPSSEVAVIGSAFVVTGRTAAELEAAREGVRQQVAFYASTPSYKAVLDLHGWSEAQEKLSGLARQGRWEAMPELITDEMLAELAVEGAPEEIGALLLDRYDGLVDRLSPYGDCPADEDFWRGLAEAFHAEAG